MSTQCFKRFFSVFGEIIEDGPLGNALHHFVHLVNRPGVASKIKTASIELALLKVMQVGLIQMSEHGDRRDAIQDGRAGLKIAAIAKAYKRKDALPKKSRP